jgi:hypothetical protein
LTEIPSVAGGCVHAHLREVFLGGNDEGAIPRPSRSPDKHKQKPD